jgi:hypothetical protein
MTTPATPTAARTFSKDSSHWYRITGESCYQIEKKDKSGMRATTLRDARTLNLVPSVTTILQILHKEALVQWKIEQAVLAVVTAPRQPNEADDAFIRRVLHEEEQQHEEAAAARDLGTQIHDALELYLVGAEVPADMMPWIGPAAESILAFGKVVTTEQNLVGEGYAGRCDLIQDGGEFWAMTDYKSAKKLPNPTKGAWPEHRLQLSGGYAPAWAHKCRKDGLPERTIIRRNVYISSVNQGQFVICEHEEDWQDVYERGFAPLVKHWQWMTGHVPNQPEFAMLQRHEPTEADREAITKAAKAGFPVLPPPAPTNGPERKRKVVVTEGVRVIQTAPMIEP